MAGRSSPSSPSCCSTAAAASKSAAEALSLFGAKAALAKTLGCGVHFISQGMMRRLRSGARKPGESNVEFLARIAIIDLIAGEAILRERDVRATRN